MAPREARRNQVGDEDSYDSPDQTCLQLGPDEDSGHRGGPLWRRDHQDWFMVVSTRERQVSDRKNPVRKGRFGSGMQAIVEGILVSGEEQELNFDMQSFHRRHREMSNASLREAV